MHQQAVSCLSFYAGCEQVGARVLSASLDGAVRVLDPTSFKPLHSFKFPDAVLAAAVSVGRRRRLTPARQRLRRRHRGRRRVVARQGGTDRPAGKAGAAPAGRSGGAAVFPRETAVAGAGGAEGGGEGGEAAAPAEVRSVYAEV